MGSDGVEVHLVIPPAPQPTPTVSSPPRPSATPDGLPTTGADVLAALLVAVLLIAFGALLVSRSFLPRRTS
jgi:hypothetical protein